MCRQLTFKALMALMLATVPFCSWGQLVFQKKLAIPVTENGRTLTNAWMGGINTPQFNTIDLNNDGKLDMVVFDRGGFDAGKGHNGHRLLTFLNTGTAGQISYTYAPQYESWFPPLSYWVKLVDYNCDGIEDILSSTPGQVDLYIGSRDGNGRLSFAYKGFLAFQTFAGPLNIYVSTTDIAGVADVNGDGDLDIVTFEQLAYTADYFENLSEELTGSCGDTIIFKQVEDCWGKFQQTGLTHGVTFQDTCGFLSPKRDDRGSQRHNGSSLLLFDQDGDGDQDLILGDVYYDNLVFLTNGGNADSAKMIAQDTTFPSYSVPVNEHIFPAAYYLDVNNDGKKDLITCPNSPRISENYNCAWYYKNVSTNDTVVFQYQSDSFLVNTTLDFGEGANPAFFDYNHDGLMDIVVGNYGYYISPGVYHAGLALLKNVGTASTPSYQLIDRDYQGLSALRYNNNPVLQLAPAFGDMDGDGDLDMVVGDSSGRLYYYQNNPVGGIAQFTQISANYFSIDVGANSSPFIYDVNGDGLPDMLVGCRNGNVFYYENRGTAQSPAFNQLADNSFFGGLDARYTGFLTGYSHPVITQLDSSNKRFLISGNEEGRIIGYLFDPDKIYSGTFRKVFDYYSGIDDGEQASTTVADIDNDGKMEMVVGNYRGGLGFYQQVDSLQAWLPDSLSGIEAVQQSAPSFVLYPNPAMDVLHIVSNNSIGQPLEIVISDMLGRRLLQTRQAPMLANQAIDIDIATLGTGIYICTLQTQQGLATYKFIKQ